MSEQDDYRVEARPPSIGRGTWASPEKIEDLQDRWAAFAKLDRKKPQAAFSEVLAQRGSEAPKAAAPQIATADTKQPTPRPGVRHPGERGTYGVSKQTRVILKG